MQNIPIAIPHTSETRMQKLAHQAKHRRHLTTQPNTSLHTMYCNYSYKTSSRDNNTRTSDSKY